RISGQARSDLPQHQLRRRARHPHHRSDGLPGDGDAAPAYPAVRRQGQPAPGRDRRRRGPDHRHHPPGHLAEQQDQQAPGHRQRSGRRAAARLGRLHAPGHLLLRAVRAGLYRRGSGPGREKGPAHSGAQRPPRPQHPDRQRCRPDPPLPHSGTTYRRAEESRSQRDSRGAYGVLPEAFRQAGVSQRRRTAPAVGSCRTRRMIQPYRITELPWQADPLPGLLAIRGMGHPVLLDSAASGDPRSRYSILAADPAMVISAERNESGLSTIARLRAALQDLGPASWPDQLQLPFGAGALGFVSYDFGRALESLPVQAKADISLPLLQMGIYHWSVISDNQARRRWLVCHPRVAREYEEQVLMRLGSRDPSEQSFALRQPFAAEQRKDEYLQSF